MVDVHSKVIAVFAEPMRFKLSKVIGPRFCTITVVDITKVQLASIVPAPVKPSRRLNVNRVIAAGAAVVLEEKITVSAMCLTVVPPEDLDAVAEAPMPGFEVTDHLPLRSLMRALLERPAFVTFVAFMMRPLSLIRTKAGLALDVDTTQVPF